MSYSSRVDVRKPIQQLEEHRPRDIGRESASSGEHFEQLTSLRIVHDDRQTFVSRPVLLSVDTLLTYVQNVNNVRVVELTHDSQLVFEDIEGSCVLELFDSNEPAILCEG